MESRMRLLCCVLLLLLVVALECRLCAASAGTLIKEPEPEERKQQEGSAQSNQVHCSRPRSRLAWSIIDEYLLPFVENEKYDLSSKCRLSRANDMFREQEEKKEEVRPRQWECGVCKKVFRTEEDLDRHFDNRHSNMTGEDRNRCLANVCPAIHCDAMQAKRNSKLEKGKCNQAAVDRNRHLCEALADACFPPHESSQARRLNDFFLRQFCDAHTCKKGQRRFPRGSGKQHGRSLYIAGSLFSIIMLLIFYGGVFASRSGRSDSAKFKRLQKSQKSH